MIYKELEKIVSEQRANGFLNDYIKNTLKEYLQVYALHFIYTSPQYNKNLIFTGGTCLKHFYGLERLSEDLDFDFIEEFSAKEFIENLKKYFYLKYKFSNLTTALKQKEKQLLLKFPVLKALKLAENHESDFLYVKIDLSKIPSKNYLILTTSKSSFGMNYAAKHYDLPSLMAGKLHAILTRRYNSPAIKGRDYFDLLWFIKKGVHPNLKRLSDMLGEETTLKFLESKIDERVDNFINKHKGDFESDIKPLLQDTSILKMYVDNYKNEYLRLKAQSFSQDIMLFLKCQKCKHEFSTGIKMDCDIFESMTFIQNIHVCPFCKHKFVAHKKNYLSVS